MSTISCLSWVKRGVAKRQPDKVKLGPDELKKLILDQEARLTKLELAGESDSESGDEQNDEEDHTVTETGTVKRKHTDDDEDEDTEDDDEDVDFDDITQKYGLDDYDDEAEGDADGDDPKNPLGLKGLACFSSNDEDPFLEKEDNDAEDDEDLIEPEDNMIAIGKVNGQFCNLEVYIYNENQDHMFCHHDILLPCFPLALEWLDFDPGEDKPGNYVAMGTMEPDIEIWDLDMIDTMEPAFVLAGASRKKGKKKKRTGITGHTDAVLDLSWNQLQRKVLASASADFTVGIWDLENGKMVTSVQHHSEKVQTIEWHPFEPQTLLSGSFDHTVKLYDCRSPDEAHKNWDLPGEVERVIWNHHDPFYFLASTDTGYVYCMDVRDTKPVFTLKAHSSAVSGLSLSSAIPGCLVTTSSDKALKVWDIRENKPSMVVERNIKIGDMACAAASPDSPLIFAVGGETEMKVLNLRRNLSVREHFLSSGGNEEQDEDAGDEIAAEGMDDNAEENEALGDEAAGLAAEMNVPEPVKKKNKKKKKKDQSQNGEQN